MISKRKKRKPSACFISEYLKNNTYKTPACDNFKYALIPESAPLLLALSATSGAIGELLPAGPHAPSAEGYVQTAWREASY